MSAIIKKLNHLEKEAVHALESAGSIENLYQEKARYLGKKGLLSEVLHELKDLSPEERKEIGAKANGIKNLLETAVAERTKFIENEQIERELAKEKLDITLP